MHRHRTLLLTLALTGTALAAHAENPKAGQWARQTSMSADGQHWKPLPARQDCLTPAQANQSIEQTLQLMVSQALQSGCRALDLKADGGQARGRFECQQPGTPATIDVDGRYTADQYDMTLVGTNLADRNGSGVVVPKLYMKYQGRHVGACAG
ncbi:MAG TPA: DUF3617 family protein [Ideonella sp.]|jgi:hypothetical protein|nr:DUF3617 family protein [Ideonella sp.]